MDMDKLINDYLQWLKAEISFTKIGEYYEITTPFLDMENDYFQLYVKQEGNTIYFSDDGFLINSLTAQNISISPKIRKQVKDTALLFGSFVEDNALVTKVPAEDFPQAKHSFVQAMIRISDMLSTIKSRKPSIFADEVNQFFAENEIYASKNIQLVGKTGYHHKYDFIFSPTKNKPERLCNAINQPNRSNINLTLFSWTDTYSVRSKNSEFILLLNDFNGISDDVVIAIENYNARMIPWSERKLQKNIELLTANN